MKKRAILTTVVCFLLLVAVVAAGLNTVFTVTHMDADFTVCSSAGERDATEIKKKLDGFVGKSTTFLDLGEVRAVVDEYPCFRVDSLEKKFPSTISVKISERNETYAFARGDGYAILDADGAYLYDKSDNVNRRGGENILLSGFTLTAERGELASGEFFGELLTVFGVFREALEEPRANVLSVELARGGAPSSGIYHFRIAMREGVLIELSDVAAAPEAMAREAIRAYDSLTDGEKTCGRIFVYERDGIADFDYRRQTVD